MHTLQLRNIFRVLHSLVCLFHCLFQVLHFSTLVSFNLTSHLRVFGGFKRRFVVYMFESDQEWVGCHLLCGRAYTFVNSQRNRTFPSVEVEQSFGWSWKRGTKICFLCQSVGAHHHNCSTGNACTARARTTLAESYSSVPASCWKTSLRFTWSTTVYLTSELQDLSSIGFSVLHQRAKDPVSVCEPHSFHCFHSSFDESIALRFTHVGMLNDCSHTSNGNAKCRKLVHEVFNASS